MAYLKSKRVWQTRSVAITVLAAGALVAGCGSSSSTDSSSTTSSGKIDVAGAKANVQKYLPVPSTAIPVTPFDASKAKGKEICAIPINSALPYQQNIDAGMQEAAKDAGVQLKILQNQGAPKDWVAGIEQCISRKPALIMLDAAPNPAQLQPQIADAKKAGIPIIATNMPTEEQFPPGALSANNVANLDGVTPGPYGLPSELLADYAVANTPGGKVNAIVVGADEVASGKGMRETVVAQLKKRCPDCKTTVLNVPLVDWATKIQTQIQTALTADPTINWVLPIYDAMVQFAIPAIRAANRTGKVQIASYNGSPPFLKELAQGDILAADVGASLNWAGWAAMDQALRLMAGVPAFDYKGKSAIPVRIWTDQNVSEAGTPPDSAKGYGSDYKDQYLKLWGLTQ